jgi:hypothetical protein
VSEDHTHPATAELLNDAVMRNGLSDRWRESYVCETGKSTKAAVSQAACWRNIAIPLIDTFPACRLHQAGLSPSRDSHRFQCPLLSDGTVPVKPATFKEAVTHHAVAKQKKEDCQQECKHKLSNSERRWPSSSRARRVRGTSHRLILPTPSTQAPLNSISYSCHAERGLSFANAKPNRSRSIPALSVCRGEAGCQPSQTAASGAV